MDLRPHIEKFATRMTEVETELGDPKVFENNRRAQELGREYARLKDLVSKGKEFLKAKEELEENRELIAGDDAEMAEMAQEEITRLESRVPELERELQFGLVPPDPTDSRNTIIEIRAGAGGDESALFTGVLFRMYTHYADGRGWKHETMSSTAADLGGFKEVVFSLSGEEVYKRLKFESGVHRVQRVPVTESQGRVHTSAATVAVLPEAEEVDVNIEEKDLRIDVFRSSGPGGQSVNTTDSAVRITHIPTGIVVSQQDEKSQIRNKEKGLKILRSRIYELERQKIDDARSKDRRNKIGTGDRSERIRTYNFPQGRVTDHRINLTLHKLEEFMQGEIFEDMIENLTLQAQEEELNKLK